MARAKTNTNAKTRAIIYVRQSISREESISLELQERACRDYAQRQGYEVVGDPLQDPGISGLQFEKRPGIRRAIAAVEAKSVRVVIVYRWSRLSRRQHHQAVILHRIEAAGGRVESATEPVDTRRASGRFNRNVMLAAAELESEQKSEQWKEAQARRRERGLPTGGAPPFGYAQPAERGQPFVPDPVRGPLLAEMYAAYLRGLGYQAIARRLNAEGHLTPPRRDRARGVHDPVGRPFSVVAVQRILDSGFGSGWLRLDVNVRDRDGKRIDQPVRWERGAHQSVIDERSWQAYQRERDKRRVVHPKARQPRWHLGGGLAVCGKCGGNLIINTYTLPKSQACCSKYKSERSCSGVWMNRQTIELAVAMWLGGHVDAWADAQEELQATDDERAALAMDLEAMQGQEERVAEGLTTAARLVASGAMSESDYLEARVAADAERAEVSQRVDDLQRQLDALNPDADVYERLRRGSDGQSSEEWNAILKRVINSVKVFSKLIVIEPVRGKTVEIDATTVMPRA